MELYAGRLLRSDAINPRLFDWITLVSISQEKIEKRGWLQEIYNYLLLLIKFVVHDGE